MKESKTERWRNLKVYTSCKTLGVIELGETWCQDPECKSCSSFRESLKKEAQKDHKRDLS